MSRIATTRISPRSKRCAHVQGTQIRLSPTASLIEAVAVTLKTHPKLNALLDAANQQFVLKKYYHIDVAIDMPTGLVVGVIQQCI